MSIHIGKPYKIVAFKHKRYNAHYNIPSDDCLIVPLKEFGEEAQCDIRWEDVNGELQVIHNKMFISDYLLPLNGMLHDKLFEIWDHYYSKVRPEVVAIANEA